MKNSEKKNWTKPRVSSLSIKKETASGATGPSESNSQGASKKAAS